MAGYNMHLEGDVISQTLAGRYQTTPDTRPSGGTINIGLPREIGAFIDNVAPGIVLNAGQAAQQAADIQLASVETDFRMALASQLLAQAPSMTDEELTEALRAELAKSDIQAQLRQQYLAAIGENNTAYINIDKLGNSGLQNIKINSNGAVILQAGETPLQLADNVSLQLKGERIAIDRSVASTGGNLSFSTLSTIGATVKIDNAPALEKGITLADSVTLDVSGEYINDFNQATVPEQRSIAIDGGSIALAIDEDQTLLFGANNRLLAEDGAHVDLDGDVDAGKGGSISLDASGVDSAFRFSDAPLVGDDSVSSSNGLVLSARALEDNGTLSLAAEGFLISDKPQTKTDEAGTTTLISSAESTGVVSRLDQGVKGNQLGMSSAFFEDGAFSEYALKATRGDVVIDANTTLDLVQQNFALNDASIDIESADTIRGVSSVETLDARLRNAVDFSISQKTRLDAGSNKCRVWWKSQQGTNHEFPILVTAGKKRR